MKGITFREDEVEILAQVMQALLRGGDVKVLLRSEPARRAMAKILGAAARAKREDVPPNGRS